MHGPHTGEQPDRGICRSELTMGLTLSAIGIFRLSCLYAWLATTRGGLQEIGMHGFEGRP